MAVHPGQVGSPADLPNLAWRSSDRRLSLSLNSSSRPTKQSCTPRSPHMHQSNYLMLLSQPSSTNAVRLQVLSVCFYRSMVWVATGFLLFYFFLGKGGKGMVTQTCFPVQIQSLKKAVKQVDQDVASACKQSKCTDTAPLGQLPQMWLPKHLAACPPGCPQRIGLPQHLCGHQTRP
jgi:hypothetical protein